MRHEFYQQLGDTWEFDLSGQGTWMQRTPSHSPTPRINHGMAYDRVRGRVVLVGGYDMETGALLGDVWHWDGTDWSMVALQPSSITPTEDPATAYDPRTNRTVMFGGRTGAGPSDTTYELLGF